MKEETKTMQELLAQDAPLTEKEWDQLMLGIMNITEEDPDKAPTLYQAAYKKAHTWDQLYMIAHDVSIILNDNEWGKELCSEVVEKAKNAVDYAIIAGIISDVEGLDDEEWAKSLFHKAVEKSEKAIEYCIIAEIISHPDALDDKKWAKELFEIALKKSDSEEMTADIKESMEECLEE